MPATKLCPAMKIIISIILLITSPIYTYAQTGNDVLSQKVIVKPGKYKLIQVLERLNGIKGINITYNSNSLPLESEIE